MASNRRGKYIVIEGADGTGKSTQLSLLAKYLGSKGVDYIEFSEPEGTPISDEIRTVIKNGTLERSAQTNLLLFTAARHEIWKRRAIPALEAGKWVIASRNYFSTLVYQGYGEGLDLQLITDVTRTFTNERYMKPDIAIILSLPEHTTRMQRIGKRGDLKHPDTFESRDEDFQDKLHFGYLEIAKTENLPVVDASQSIENTFTELKNYIPV